MWDLFSKLWWVIKPQTVNPQRHRQNWVRSNPLTAQSLGANYVAEWNVLETLLLRYWSGSLPRWQSAESTRRVSWTGLGCPADRSRTDSPWFGSESTHRSRNPDDDLDSQNTQSSTVFGLCSWLIRVSVMKHICTSRNWRQFQLLRLRPSGFGKRKLGRAQIKSRRWFKKERK